MSAERVVAVLDGEAVKAIPVVRALGEAGMDVHLISFETLSPAGASRWCRRHTRMRRFDPRRVRDLMKTRGIRLLLPLEDSTISAIHSGPDIWGGVTIIQPTAGDLARFRDKAETIVLARSREVPVPETVIPADPDEAEAALREWRRFPVVIKPRISSGSRGIRIARDPRKALADYRRIHRDYPLPLLQEFIPPGGRALGVEFLFREGREIAVFAHERLRQFPIGGGPSTYCRGCGDERVIAMGRRMMEDLDYSGFAMVEFREHPESGTLYLMEVNPRPWGSIALPKAAGVDFVVAAVEAFSGDSRPAETRPGIPRDAARYHMRWLLPADFLNLLTDGGRPFGSRLRELFRRYPDTVYQVLDRRDPWPAVVMSIKMLAGVLNPRFLMRNLLRR